MLNELNFSDHTEPILTTEAQPVCKVTDQHGQEKPCIFPWSCGNEENIQGCANPDNDFDNWCPTELVNGRYISGSGNYGFCTSPECQAFIIGR